PGGVPVASVTVPLTGEITRTGIELAAPRRWRPGGRGGAALYALGVELLDGSGQVSDERRLRLGFRDVAFRRDPDAPAGALPYRLTVDGRPAVVKGWNWVPADALYGAVDADRLRHLLGLARDARVNLLRVWGGGLIESEAFYDLCDEFGILVWQEFAQSSSGMASTPSDDPMFVARMVAEAERIVPARRNHPSLAVWCGGNELQRADGVPLADADSPVLAALGEVVTRLDPDRHWLPTSPSGPVFGNTLASVVDGPEHHDVHGPWEHQGLADHYRLYDTGRALLLSEFGVEGMGNPRAVASVVPEAERRLPTVGNPVWDHLGRWWNNEPLVRRAFGDALTDLAAVGRASQFLQADGLRYAVEASRRRPECCGVLPWQLNESFPNGWCTAAVDFLGEAKAVYHHVRRAYRPLHVCAAVAAQRVDGAEFTATVWAWSDDPDGATEPARGPGRDDVTEVTARVVRPDGGTVTTARWTGPLVDGEPRAFGVLRCPTAALARGPFLLDLTVSWGGRSAGNRQWLTAGADFRARPALAPARIGVDVTAAGDTWTVRLRHTDGPAVPFLRLLDARPPADPGWLAWDDNAVDLLPGEQRVLRA
ncbi:MAG TPA: glycoside hydrolase family 2 TIM barrel-domain containing protein, partial [Micromonospora sp.]